MTKDKGSSPAEKVRQRNAAGRKLRNIVAARNRKKGQKRWDLHGRQWADFRKLAAMMATQKEVAAWFGVSVDVISDRLQEPAYRRVWDEGQAQGKISLRRDQFALAKKNATMGIWLGKQYLEQEDKQRHEHSGPGGGPIEHIDPSKLSDDELRLLHGLIEKASPGVGHPGGTGDAGGAPPDQGASGEG